jgi:hypothetical protein
MKLRDMLGEERAKFGFKPEGKNFTLPEKKIHKCEVCKKVKPDVTYVNDPLGYEDELDVEMGKKPQKKWLCNDCAGERWSRQ